MVRRLAPRSSTQPLRADDRRFKSQRFASGPREYRIRPVKSRHSTKNIGSRFTAGSL
jgi:hypothetical protein